jgi:hypothetical protein
MITAKTEKALKRLEAMRNGRDPDAVEKPETETAVATGTRDAEGRRYDPRESRSPDLRPREEAQTVGLTID